jgi:hypothetical protein
VTKFSDAEHVAEYMSVHTFLTGCRGVLAPFIAFPLAAALGPGTVGGISVVLISIATAIILHELKTRDQDLSEAT